MANNDPKEPDEDILDKASTRGILKWIRDLFSRNGKRLDSIDEKLIEIDKSLAVIDEKLLSTALRLNSLSGDVNLYKKDIQNQLDKRLAEQEKLFRELNNSNERVIKSIESNILERLQTMNNDIRSDIERFQIETNNNFDKQNSTFREETRQFREEMRQFREEMRQILAEKTDGIEKRISEVKDDTKFLISQKPS